jgi:hypothetical protein
MNRAFVIAGLSVALLSSRSGAAAQMPAAPRELGMGGAYMGVARGYEAIFLAPGNLGLFDAPPWSLGFPQAAVGGSIEGPEVTDLLDYIDFDDVDESRQTELLALIPAEGTSGEFALRAPLVAFSRGGFGLGVSYSSIGRHTLSRDLAELLLDGYEDGRTDYSVGNTFGERANFWDFAVGYGRNLAVVSIGATAHYLRGRNIVRSRLFEPRIDLEAQDVEVSYIGVIARGGSGYSLDVGASLAPYPGVTVSGAVSNITSKMTWSEDLAVRSLILDRNLIDNASPKDLLNRYEASEVPLDPEAVSLEVFETANGLYDEAFLPAVGRIGVAWSPAERTHLAADLHTKLTEGRLADSWDRRISVGVQQALWILTFRAGYAAANDGGSLLGGGFSLGPLDLGVARYQQSAEEGGQIHGWIATLGLGMHMQ